MNGSNSGPRCLVVTGPRGSGKTRWLQRFVGALSARTPPARCAVLLAEEGRTRLDGVAANPAQFVLEKYVPACLCCFDPAALTHAAQQLTASSGAEWLVIEVPALLAAGFLAELDRAPGWPRTVVVCLRPPPVGRPAEGGFGSPFFAMLLPAADAVVANEASAEAAVVAALLPEPGKALALDR